MFTGVSGRSIDILFFSKILSHLWPHLQTTAAKVNKYLEELNQIIIPNFGKVKNIADLDELKNKY